MTGGDRAQTFNRILGSGGHVHVEQRLACRNPSTGVRWHELFDIVD